MIDVYKIGLDLYKDGIDKNSGLHEYSLIKYACNKIETDCKVLIIINGKKSSDDIEYLKSIWNNYDIHIFIISDAIALNDELVNECDYVLHQSIRQLPQIKKPQYYSYVPELFYNSKLSITSFNKKSDEIFFGGGIRDNEEIFDYLVKENLPLRTFTKHENGSDNRVEYSKCQSEMKKCKFAFIVSRKVYNDIGFVTARFVEAINNWCIPIVLNTYDVDNIFKTEKVKLNDVKSFYYEYNDVYKAARLLEKYHDMLNSRKDKFIELIEHIIKEYKNDKG